MNNKQEGFEENDNNFYHFLSHENLSHTAYSLTKAIKTRSKYKSTFKLPLTIFNNIVLTQAPDENMELDWGSSDSIQQDQIQSCNNIESKLQPLDSILLSQQKTIKTLFAQENNRISLQKVSDVFTKRFICVYNRLHENIFLKYDLTIIIKNVARCLKLQLLKTVENPFGMQIGKSFSKILTNDQKNEEDTEKQKDMEKKHQRKSRRYESEESLQSFKQSRKLSKKFDRSSFEIQKSMILNNQVTFKSTEIEFYSNFESGNLHLVFKDKNIENLFYLFLTNDMNTHGFNQWFYFGIKYSGNEIKKFRFVIINVSKEFKFHQNMRLLSLADGKWQRKTCFLVYKNKYSRYNGGNFVTLDFQYQFNPKSERPVFFALTYPYTFTRVVRFVKQIKSKEYKNLSVVIQTLGKTELTNLIPVIRIERNNLRKLRYAPRKKFILVMARQHASQTPSSFICQSMVRNLVSESNSSWETLLDTYKFVIIPMANPDGVIHGNSRTNIKGYDINRHWQPTKNNYTFMSTQTEEINSYLTQLLKDESIEYTIDLHSHSKDYGSFVYCCDNSENSKLFRYFFTKNHPECSYEKCKINLTSDKKCTFRGQMYHRLGIKNSYTIETSYYGFIQHHQNQPPKLVPFTLKNLQNIAQSILFTLTEIIKHQFVSDQQKQVFKIIDLMESKLKASRKSNIFKGKDQNNQSDSDPENQYLEIKERRQIGQNVPQTLQYLQNSDKKIHRIQTKKQSCENFALHNKSLHMISKKDHTISTDSEVKKKRKRIYTSLGSENAVKIEESPKQSKEAVQNSMQKKFLTNAEKQIDFRNTLRRGLKMTRSQTGFYRFRQKTMTRPKQQLQRKQITNCIVYPTSTDLQLSCDNIRLLHENLFKGRIKVKSIKEQQYRFLKRMGKSELVCDEEKHRNMKGSFQNKMILQRSADREMTRALNIGKIQKLRLNGSFTIKK